MILMRNCPISIQCSDRWRTGEENTTKGFRSPKNEIRNPKQAPKEEGSNVTFPKGIPTGAVQEPRMGGNAKVDKDMLRSQREP